MDDSPVSGLTTYEIRHLAAHLEASGRGDQLHKLLQLETLTGRNAWFDAHERAGELDGFLADVDRARRLAAARSQTGEGVVLQCRYALVQSSLRSTAENVSPPLVAALLSHHVWDIQEGLAWAGQIVDPVRRASVLCQLLPSLDERDRTSVVQTAMDAVADAPTDQTEGQVEVIGSLLEFGSPLQRQSLVRLLLDLARSPSNYVANRAWPGLTHAARYMTIDQLREAMSLSNAEQEDPPIPLVLQLPEPERSQVASRVLASSRERARVQGNVEVCSLAIVLRALMESTPALVPPDALHEALSLALNASEKVYRNSALGDLLPHLKAAEQRECVERMLADWSPESITDQQLLPTLARSAPSLNALFLQAALAVPDPARRRSVLIDLGRNLGEPEREAAVAALIQEVRSSENTGWFTSRFQEIAPLLSAQQAQELVGWAATTLAGLTRAQLLIGASARLAPDMRGPVLRAAEALLTTARAELHEPWDVRHWTQATSLIQCASWLPETEREQIVRGILAFVSSLQDVAGRTLNFLTAAAPVLSADLVNSALSLARRVRDERDWPEPLGQIIRYISPAGQRRVTELVVRCAESADGEWPVAAWIDRFTPDLAESVVPQVLEAARNFTQPALKAAALASLVPRLRPGDQAGVFAEARAATKEIEDPRPRAEALAKLALVSARNERDRLVEESLNTLQSVDAPLRLRVLTMLLPLLPPDRREEVATDTLKMLDKGSHPEPEMCEMIPFLSEETIRRQLQTSLWIAAPVDALPGLLKRARPQNSSESPLATSDARIVAALLVQVAADGAPRDALELALTPRRDGTQLWILTSLAPHLPDELVREMFQAADKLVDAGTSFSIYDSSSGGSSSYTFSQQDAREFLRSVCCPLLSRAGDVQRAYQLAGTISDPGRRARAMAGVARAALEAGGSNDLDAMVAQALESVERIDDTAYRIARAREAVLDELAPVVAALPPAQFQRVWQSVLDYLRLQTRKQVVSELCRLMPAVKSAAGSDGCDELVQAIQDVARWWP